jgi:hypothetical protein
MASNEETERIFHDYDEKMSELFYSLNLQPLENRVNQMNSSISESMPDISLISSALINALEPLKETIDKISPDLIMQNLEKSSDIMFNNGWWLIPTMPFPFYTKLAELESINKKDLTDYLVKYYNEHKRLDSMINGWKLEKIMDNKEILEDALWAHKQLKFTLSVPALTIQVEWTLRSYFDHKLDKSIHIYYTELKKQYEQTIKNQENLDYGEIFERFTKIQNIKFIEKGFEMFTKSFDPGKPRDFDDLHRHPLFHGQFKNYNTIELSTKLFLFLDMIYYILDDLETFKKRKKLKF